MNATRLQTNIADRSAAFDPDGPHVFRQAKKHAVSMRLRRTIMAIIAAVSLLCVAQSDVQADELVEYGEQPQAELVISGWQGAKSYAESFPITIGGGSSNGAIRFLCTNCTVSPQTGTVADTYTVSVQNAGNYSLTAIMAGNSKYAEISDSRRGVSGKADQTPLAIEGWGKSKGYYKTFAIKVTGGSLNNAVTFETDGCSVSPQTGPVGSQFTVTVTRVGTYSLTALMDGDRNHNKAYSAQQSGVSCKSEQISHYHRRLAQRSILRRCLQRQYLRRKYARADDCHQRRMHGNP